MSALLNNEFITQDDYNKMINNENTMYVLSSYGDLSIVPSITSFMYVYTR